MDGIKLSYLLNQPQDFVDEMTEAFVAAHRHLVRGVYGGVVRNTTTPADRVAIIVVGPT